MRRCLAADRLQQLGEAFIASPAEHMGDRPGEATREELLQQAENADVEGASSKTKEELTMELRGDD
ncbi:MAG: hypothetical protein ACR2JU_16660 [Nocardioidaceae bacterium]